MNVLETEWWTMALPPEWWAEMEDDSVLIGDRDDVGCIEISTLHSTDGDFDEQAVRRIATGEKNAGVQPVRLGEFAGWYSTCQEEGMALREWFVAGGPIMLFITYSCDKENSGMDNSAVDEILDTLLLVEPAAEDGAVK